MPEPQAEALADEQSRLIEKQLAIIRSGIEMLKHELPVRVGGMIMALGGVLVAIKSLGRRGVPIEARSLLAPAHPS